MTCANCGTELPVGAMFCGECGRAVPASRTSSVPVARVKVGKPSATETAPVVVQTAATEHCSQCGAVLASTDIFCGECGFVRVLPSRASTDTAVLDPFPWGAPDGAPPAPPEPPAPPAASTDVEDVDDVEATRIVGHEPRGERFVLQFSTGESVTVSGTGLLGRNPVAEPGEYFDTIVRIADPGKSVSKTHLEFGQDAAMFWISDRFSGNGTVFREPDSAPRRCDPGKRYRIARGTRVDIGEQFFIVS